MTSLLRSLLRLFPADFRRRYGEELVELLIMKTRDVRAHRGWMGVFRLWTFHGFDLLRSAMAERRGPPGPGRWHRSSFTSSLLQDVRCALRNFRRQPLFTTVAVLTLAIGIGASTAIFSVVDVVLLRPLPYDDPGQLVRVWQTYPNWRGDPLLQEWWDRIALSYPEYVDWTEQQTVFQQIAISGGSGAMFVGGAEPTRLEIREVTASLFPLLRIRPAIGRLILPSDDTPGADPVALLSHGFWQRQFGGDASVVGRDIRLGDTVFSIVGVLPPTFHLEANESELGQQYVVWTALGRRAESLARGSRSLRALARLKPGVGLAQATAETESILRGESDPAARGVRLLPYQDDGTEHVRTPLLILLAAVGLLLFIACGNVANLLLGAATARELEISVRSALGAGRMRIVRQLLTESVLLATIGAILGSAIAFWATKTLVAMAPAGMPRVEEIGVDVRVLAFAFGVALLTGVLFGLAPALSLGKTSASQALRSGARRTSHARGKLQETVVIGEVALSIVLLVGAGLLGRSLLRLTEVDPGFQPDNLLTMRVSLSGARYSSPEMIDLFYQQATSRLGSLPGVEAVSGVTSLPLTGYGTSTSTSVEGLEEKEGQRARPEVRFRLVLPDYFSTMRIRLVDGGYFSNAQHQTGERVAIVNETAADQFWPGESAVGKRIEFNREWHRIVGVVSDVKQLGLDQEPQTALYVPGSVSRQRTMRLVILTTTNALSLAGSAREALWSIDDQLPIEEIRTMNQVIDGTLLEERYRVVLMALFAAVAAVLAGIGIYGVTAHAVSQRTHEMGIRLAMGAQRGAILNLVLWRSAKVALVGVMLGVLVAAGVTRVLSQFLFGVRATDPATYIAVGVAVTVIVLLASYVPALRATRLDPLRSLQSD